ncbi:hypothetical protein DM53_441 [Burkholderia mallei]|nr:hypothetical protein DM53_441 [Burkholderia mallei]
MDAFGRARDEIDLRALQQAEQLRAVRIVVRAHRRRMARRHARADPAHARFLGEHLEKARVRIVGLVAVHIDQAAAALGEIHQEPDRAHALLARVLEVRNAADDVRAHLDCPLHQRAAAAERFDAFLRERDDLQIDQPARLVLHLEHRLQRRERRVGHVDVRAHVLNAVIAQHPDRRMRAGLRVLVRDRRLALRPALDPLEQRAAHVPFGLARRQHRVEMDVRLDERRDHELAVGVDHVRPRRVRRVDTRRLRRDARDRAAVEHDAEKAAALAQRRVDELHQNSCRCVSDIRHASSATDAFSRKYGSASDCPDCVSILRSR